MKRNAVGMSLLEIAVAFSATWTAGIASAAVLERFNVGFTVERYEAEEAGQSGGMLTVAVWYPTKEAERTDTYGDGTVSRFAHQAGANEEDAPYPLVVFSHGYGGSGIGSIFLCEHLARHGFVVAAPDHGDKHVVMRMDGPTGANLREYLRSAGELARTGLDFDRGAHEYRTRELSLTVDMMLEENERPGSPLQGIIDPDRIGAAGHSLGGYTVLAACGFVESAEDDRISAALLLSGGVFMFRPEEFGKPAVPVMFMYGERETGRLRARLINPKGIDTRRAYSSCSPPKFMLEIRGANHFSFGQVVFSDSLIGSGARLGEQIASTIEAYGLAFFERYLLDREEAEAVLSSGHPMVTRQWFDTGSGSAKDYARPYPAGNTNTKSRRYARP